MRSLAYSAMGLRTACLLTLSAVFLITGCASRQPARAPLDLSKVVDLSYTFGPDTIYWPTAEGFTMKRVSYGMTPHGYWYAANNICMAEHGGTHMDAPIHFAQGKRAADEVPVQQLIGPAVVIDVRAQSAKDADYRLTVADLEAWEKQH